MPKYKETKTNSIDRVAATITPATSVNGQFEAVIAVNDDVGDGFPVPLRSMDFDTYLKNPVVLFAHDRWNNIPIAQTTALNWTDRGLLAKFRFLPRDKMAQRVKNAWQRGFLRAASIGVRKTGNSDNYELIEWSIVPVPADKDAVRSAMTSIMDDIFSEDSGDIEMDESEIKEMITKALKDHKEDSSRHDDLVKTITDTITKNINDTIKARQDSDAEIERRVEEGIAERMSKKKAEEDEMKEKEKEKMSKKKADDEDMKEKEKGLSDEELEARAEERADLLVMVKELLPDDFKVRGASNHDIMIAAVGDEVENAKDRSADYLMAKLENIIETRAAAEKSRSSGANNKVPVYRSSGRIDVTKLRK